MKASEVAHVQHGALAGLDLRLPHDRQAVGDRLDAGVGAAAQRVGPDEQQQQAADAQRGGAMAEPVAHARAAVAGQLRRCPRMPPPMTRRGSPGRAERPGAGSSTDSRTPRMFKVVSTRMKPNSTGSFAAVPPRGQEAEERVTRGGDRDGDGEDVVHQQRRRRRRPPHLAPAGCWPPRSRRRPVGNSSMIRPVGGRDQQHGGGHERRQRHGEIGVPPSALNASSGP